MASTWIFALLAGLALSGSALDPDLVADRIIARLDAILPAHASQWFSLPGFDISFSNENVSLWQLRNGEVSSIGGVERDQNKSANATGPAGPNHFVQGSPSVFIKINITNFVLQYKFRCSDFYEVSGYTYSMNRTVPTQATIVVHVKSDSPWKCHGELGSTRTSFNYEIDGSDFSKITPDDQYAKQCIQRSYTKVQDYSNPINEQLEKHYGDAVDEMLKSAMELAMTDLNLCPQ